MQFGAAGWRLRVFERPNIAKVVFILSRFSREDTASKHGDLKTWIVKAVLYQKQRGNQSTKHGSWSCGNSWFFASIAQKTTGLTERNQICLQIRLAFRQKRIDENYPKSYSVPRIIFPKKPHGIVKFFWQKS